jgi:hypothetical protein
VLEIRRRTVTAYVVIPERFLSSHFRCVTLIPCNFGVDGSVHRMAGVVYRCSRSLPAAHLADVIHLSVLHHCGLLMKFITA